ncbi:hypothetical protein PQY69_04095 [Flavobacteriaceae bacterium]|nr:hypothetical protein [Flavobacteriaceae bacterium]
MDLRTISNFSIALAIVIASIMYAISNKYEPVNSSDRIDSVNILNTWNGEVHNFKYYFDKPKEKLK